MDVLDFQQLGDMDGGIEFPLTGADDTDIFSMFLPDSVGASSDSSLSPPSAHSGSPASSPVSASGGFSEDSLFDPDTSNPAFCNEMFNSMSMDSEERQSAVAVKQEQADEDDSDSDSDSGDGKPRPNKRNFTAMESSVTLTREELRNMSSKGLEEYAAKLAATRHLTKSEERALKRQRRLVKNRESAQLSRARKKMYVEELERKVNTISVHSERMAAQMAHLAAENKALKEEVYMLRNALKQQQEQQRQFGADGALHLQMEEPGSSSGPGSPASVGSPHSGDEMQQQGEGERRGMFTSLTSLDPLSGFAKTRVTDKARTAGMCLFIILLSFGVFFSATTLGPAGPEMPAIVRREPIPEVFPQGMQRGYTGRTLKSLGGAGAGAAAFGSAARTSSFGGGGAVAMDVEEAEDLSRALSTGADRFAAPSSTVQTAADHHVLCTEAYKMAADEEAAAATRFGGAHPQPTFTLVLPPSALQGAVPNVDKVADGQLLEVGCHIVSLNVVPSFDDLPMLGDGEPDRVVIPARDVVASA